MDRLARFSVSPVFTVLDAVSAAENRKFPPEELSHTEMWLTTSPFVPAQVAQDGSVVVMALEPADAAAQVRAGRVVTDDTLAVPAAPGMAVWS
jgi:hypothetical protein